MKELLKKGLIAGLGILAITREEVESILTTLVKKGKITADAAESVAEEFFKESRKTIESAEKSFSRVFEIIAQKIPYADKAELQKLKKRIEILEKELKNRRRKQPKK